MAERLLWWQLNALWDRGGDDPGDALFKRWARSRDRLSIAVERWR